jgi:hypothetical protein
MKLAHDYVQWWVLLVAVFKIQVLLSQLGLLTCAKHWTFAFVLETEKQVGSLKF